MNEPTPDMPPAVTPPSGLVPSTSPPVAAFDVIQQQTSAQDYVVLRFAVIGLILAINVTLVGVMILSYGGQKVPEGLIAIGSTAVGALATMLVRPPLLPPGRPVPTPTVHPTRRASDPPPA